MKNKLPEKFWIEIFSESHFNLVMEKLGELGWRFLYPINYAKGIYLSNKSNKYHGRLGFSIEGAVEFYTNNKDEYGDAISTDFLLSCFVSKKITVPLNSSYTAELSSEGIKVGCQTFSLNIIDKLVDARKQLD